MRCSSARSPLRLFAPLVSLRGVDNADAGGEPAGGGIGGGAMLPASRSEEAVSEAWKCGVKRTGGGAIEALGLSARPPAR